MDKLDELTFHIHNYSDFSKIAVPSEVKAMVIHGDYSDALPALYDFINLQELYFNVPITWKYIESVNLESLKILSFMIDDSKEACKLSFPNLEKLSINNISKKDLTPIEKMLSSTMLTGYDFSNLPKLTSLNLYYFLGFDFNKTIFPKSLRSLRVRHSIVDNVDWCLVVSNIRELDLSHNNISNIDSLAYLPKLEILNLSYNDITDVSCLSNVDTLKRVNLKNNPVTKTGDIYNCKHIETVIISEADIECEKIKETAVNLKDNTRQFIALYDKYIANRSAYLQLKNLEERSISADIRLRNYLQQNFEYIFDRISPFNAEYPHYNVNYKMTFIKYAIQNLSILTAKDRMYDRINFEHNIENHGLSCLEKEKGEGAIVQVTDDDIYFIDCQLEEGSGHLKFVNFTPDEKLNSQLVRAVIFNICKVAEKENSIKYDYRITVKSLFGKRPTAQNGLGIITSIYCKLNNIKYPKNAVFYSSLSTRGGLKKKEFNSNVLRYLDNINTAAMFTAKNSTKLLNEAIRDNTDFKIKNISCTSYPEMLESMIDYINKKD